MFTDVIWACLFVDSGLFIHWIRYSFFLLLLVSRIQPVLVLLCFTSCCVFWFFGWVSEQNLFGEEQSPKLFLRRGVASLSRCSCFSFFIRRGIVYSSFILSSSSLITTFSCLFPHIFHRDSTIMATQEVGPVQTMTERSKNHGQRSNNPMFLQTSNNTGMVLVTVSLTDTNFLTWSRSIQRALAVKNEIGFISGALPQPASEPERSVWRRTNEMDSAWILNSISKEIAETFIYSSSARKLCVDLEEQFVGSNGP